MKNEYTLAEAKVVLLRELKLQRLYAKDGHCLHIPGILGGVGLGKTALVREVAAEMELPLVKINCGEESDPTELLGFGRVDKVGTFSRRMSGDRRVDYDYAMYLLNKQLASACAKPALLLFDDVDKSVEVIQGALLNVLGERRTRDRKLHPKTLVVCAGNKGGDDILARPLSESLRTRAHFFTVKPDMGSFLVYAEKTNMHPYVVKFLSDNAALLHKPDPRGHERFPTPRGWDELSRHLRTFPDLTDAEIGRTVARYCGSGAAAEYVKWFGPFREIDCPTLFTTPGRLSEKIFQRAKRGDLEAQSHILLAVTSYLSAPEAASRLPLPKDTVNLVEVLKLLTTEQRAALASSLVLNVRAWMSKIPGALAALRT